MPCIRTGAHIYIEPYQEWAISDAFEIEPLLSQARWMELHRLWGSPPLPGLYYFRISHRSREPLRDTHHFTIHDYDNWFDKDGKESLLVTNNCSYHGYNGMEIKDGISE